MTENLLVEQIWWTSKTGLPLIPSILITFCLFLVIILITSFVNHKPYSNMQQSKIKRSVNGNPTDPNSTRDLSNISPVEMQHMKLALRGSIREAEGFLKMNDQDMLAVVQNSQQVNTDLGLSFPDPGEINHQELRKYFREGLGTLASLLEKFDSAQGTFFRMVKAITPGEYRRMITAFQASIREATIYAQVSIEDFHLGIAHLKEMYKDWGLDPWDHYDPYLREFPFFFEKRVQVLIAVLEKTNQPYPGVKYPE